MIDVLEKLRSRLVERILLVVLRRHEDVVAVLGEVAEAGVADVVGARPPPPLRVGAP